MAQFTLSKTKLHEMCPSMLRVSKDGREIEEVYNVSQESRASGLYTHDLGRAIEKALANQAAALNIPLWERRHRWSRLLPGTARATFNRKCLEDQRRKWEAIQSALAEIPHVVTDRTRPLVEVYRDRLEKAGVSIDIRLTPEDLTFDGVIRPVGDSFFEVYDMIHTGPRISRKVITGYIFYGGDELHHLCVDAQGGSSTSYDTGMVEAMQNGETRLRGTVNEHSFLTEASARAYAVKSCRAQIADLTSYLADLESDTPLENVALQ